MSDMTSLDFRGRVSRADLAALVDSAGASSPLSPRPLLGPASPLAPAASPSFAAAARVVARASLNLTVRLWSGEAAAVEMNVLFAGPPALGQGVVLNPVEAGYDVAGFVDAERILSLVAPALPPEPPTAPPPFEVQADVDTMIALAGCLDALQRDALAGRAARLRTGRPLAPRLLDEARPLAGIEIATYLKEMWGFSRFDQLLTAIFPFAARVTPPSLADIDAALARLVSLGLLRLTRPDRFEPADPLEPVLRGLLGMASGLQWQRVGLQPDGVLMVSERIFLFGNGGAVFVLQPTAAGTVRLSLATRRSVVDFLVAELSPTVPEGISAPALRFCRTCGAALKDGWKFCGRCGAAVKETRHVER